MIHIVIPRESKDAKDGFDEYALQTILRYKLEHLEVINDPNSLDNSIFSKFNHVRDEFIKRNYPDNDIVILCHADVKVLDPFLEDKLNIIFSKKPNLGLVGVIGTKSFPEKGGWWLTDYSHHLGRVIQGKNDGTTFELSRGIGFSDEMVSVDGCFMAVRCKAFKEVEFNERLFQNSYHFYDVSYCISLIEKGYDVGVCDILIQHKSEGEMPQSWYVSKEKFNSYIIGKGYTFPLTKLGIRNRL